MRVAFVAATLLLALGCQRRLPAPQPDEVQSDAARSAVAEEAVDLLLERSQRVLRVGFRLRAAGSLLCGESVAPALGVQLQEIDEDVDLALHEALARRFGGGKALVVAGVLPDAPGAVAGLQVGDRISSVNGRKTREIEELHAALSRSQDPSLVVEVERAGAPTELRVERVEVCAVPFRVLSPFHYYRHNVYKRPDGIASFLIRGSEASYVTTQLLRFVEDDDELAIMLAHEVAHRVLGGRNRAYPRFELEADRLGLGIAQAAGVDPEIAPALWERYALEKPQQIVFNRKYIWEYPHARVAERLLAMPAILRELRGPTGDDAPPAP